LGLRGFYIYRYRYKCVCVICECECMYVRMYVCMFCFVVKKLIYWLGVWVGWSNTNIDLNVLYEEVMGVWDWIYVGGGEVEEVKESWIVLWGCSLRVFVVCGAWWVVFVLLLKEKKRWTVFQYSFYVQLNSGRKLGSSFK